MDGRVPGGGSGEGRHVLFRAGGERFALPLAAVREVVLPQPPFARVPRSGPAVRGAMNLRGRVIAVVELATLLGLPRERLHATQGQVLVLEAERPSVGILVHGVLGVEALPEPTRRAADGGSSAWRAALGMVAAAQGPATVLDGASLAQEAAVHFGAR